jgi:iron complex outermembrane receptor protein
LLRALISIQEPTVKSHTYILSFASVISASALAQDVTTTTTTRLEEVVVTASPLGRTLFEQAQPTSILTGERLTLRLEPTLGETLSKEPGVSSTFFAPGASRPVIRGLGADRIRVLQSGVNTDDVSTISPDHAVTIDPLTIETVEIVRGPATLLYGPNTIGGVVNTIDNRVPDERIEPGAFGLPLHGRIDGRTGTVDELHSGGAVVDFGIGDHIVIHLDGFTRESQDYHIPGFARSARIRERDPLPEGEKEARDVLPNSFNRSNGGAIGASYVWDGGYLGAAYSGYNATYGTVAEKDVTIGLTQRRWDVRGALTEPFNGVKSINYKIGYTSYSHTEYEGTAVGTEFDQEGYDGRIEVLHKKLGPFEGVFGFQSQKSDFSAKGEEAVQPPTETRINSAFAFEEIAFEPFRLQFGLRYDHQTNDSDTTPTFLQSYNLHFDAVSGSVGLVYTPAPDYAIALTASYNQRPPTGAELFSNGPHVATNAFEIGDPDLGLEESFALDLTARKKAGRITGSASVFYYHFKDFISADPTGLFSEAEEGEEGLPIFVYRATDANFVGGELEATLHILQPQAPEPPNTGKDTKSVAAPAVAANPHALDFTVRSDYVWVQDTKADRSLPRITPFRAGAELVYTWNDRFRAGIEGQYVARQNRTAEFELPTDSYFLLSASVSYKVAAGPVDLDFYVKGTNLTDAEARLHTSFLKEIEPLPGRGVLFGVRATF